MSGGSVTHFISDLHLCPGRPETTRLFLDYLANDAREAQALYILGDLFEFWIGDDDLGDPFNVELCEALQARASAGTRLHFMAGNRDFLIGTAFAAATGIRLITDPHLVSIGGTPTLLMHGDTLCTDDTAYLAFRTMVRSPAWQTDFLAKSLIQRKQQFEGLRRQSETEKQAKPATIMDANPATIEETLRAHGYPRLIHGHTHRRNRHRHAVDGHECERWVLGEWHEKGNYLRCAESSCEFVILPPA